MKLTRLMVNARAGVEHVTAAAVAGVADPRLLEHLAIADLALEHAQERWVELVEDQCAEVRP